MESSLIYDNKDRSLGLAFKERLRESENEIELKVSGLLNTKTGRLDGCGSLRKFFFLGRQLPGRNPYLRPAAEKRRTRSADANMLGWKGYDRGISSCYWEAAQVGIWCEIRLKE